MIINVVYFTMEETMNKPDRSKIFLLVAVVMFVGACGFYVYETKTNQPASSKVTKGKQNFNILSGLFGGGSKKTTNSKANSKSAITIPEYRVGNIVKISNNHHHTFDPKNISADQFGAFVLIYGADKLQLDEFEDIKDVSDKSHYLYIGGGYNKDSGKVQFLMAAAQTEAYTGYQVASGNVIKFTYSTGPNPMKLKDKVLGKATVNQILTYVQKNCSKSDVKEIVDRVNNEDNLKH